MLKILIADENLNQIIWDFTCLPQNKFGLYLLTPDHILNTSTTSQQHKADLEFLTL